jgi:hypothetical protein
MHDCFYWLSIDVYRLGYYYIVVNRGSIVIYF